MDVVLSNAGVGFFGPFEEVDPERAGRFIARDEELIKSAPDPTSAALQIIRVIESPRPKLHNAIDAKSRFFLALNRFLPTRLRDRLLLDQMDIR